MKYILNLIYWLLIICWGYYLIQTLITDSMDLQLFYGVKTIFYSCIMQILMIVERHFTN